MAKLLFVFCDFLFPVFSQIVGAVIIPILTFIHPYKYNDLCLCVCPSVSRILPIAKADLVLPHNVAPHRSWEVELNRRYHI